MLPGTKDMERELMEVRELLAELAVRRRDQTASDAQVTVVEPHHDAFGATAGVLMSRAVSSVEVLLAGLPQVNGTVIAALRQALPPYTAHPEPRILCTPQSWRGAVPLSSECALLSALSDDGDTVRPEVRMARLLPLTAVIADGEVALLRTGKPGPGAAAVVRAPSVVASLRALFDTVWQGATGVEEYLRLRRRNWPEVAGKVLVRLRDGVSDDTAARELAMSVRTYRRHVADIMALLGATSRFQAGVRAAEAGLLPRDG
ncbi:LuxR family transcriptional regulator [Streptomyces celluloflavus]|uniref:LuxR family transcriptional regulator n=1 Tax=Streptomyces celluloflavus TaxID=58344 RepID=UPI003662E664